ncbi:MAG TPA: hypothetical protein VMJ34_05035, partial [Bryobacteraceae bacterium]|nr:hypothetical protein [Bryobacteraceae bacterium]
FLTIRGKPTPRCAIHGRSSSPLNNIGSTPEGLCYRLFDMSGTAPETDPDAHQKNNKTNPRSN